MAELTGRGKRPWLKRNNPTPQKKNKTRRICKQIDIPLFEEKEEEEAEGFLRSLVSNDVPVFFGYDVMVKKTMSSSN